MGNTPDETSVCGEQSIDLETVFVCRFVVRTHNISQKPKQTQASISLKQFAVCNNTTISLKENVISSEEEKSVDAHGRGVHRR